MSSNPSLFYSQPFLSVKSCELLSPRPSSVLLGSVAPPKNRVGYIRTSGLSVTPMRTITPRMVEDGPAENMCATHLVHARDLLSCW